MWRRVSEPQITREDVNSIMSFMMGIDEKVDEIRSLVKAEEDGEEDA
jgi:hypothetical protein